MENIELCTNNDEKKESLRQYQESMKAVKRLEEEIRQMKLDEICPSVMMSGMPGAHNHRDLSDYVVKYDELMTRMIRQRYKRICIYSDICNCIEELKEENEKQVLYSRYIHMMTWEAIAIKMNYSYRQVLRVHGKALHNLKIKKDVTQCHI